MLKIKVYDCENELDLEKQLNNLMKQLEEHHQEVVDIKYSTSCCCGQDDEQLFIYSALVMYDDKLIEEYHPKIYELAEKVDEIIQ